MEKNKQVKYCLRKSVFGLASVSAALIVGSTVSSADELADAEHSALLEINNLSDTVSDSSQFMPFITAILDAKTEEEIKSELNKAQQLAASGLGADQELNAEKKWQDAWELEANRLNDKAETAKNIEGFSEGLNTLTGSEVKTVEDYKLEFAKDAALKEFDKYGVSDFYKKMIEKAGTVEGVKQLQSEVVEAAKANRIQEGTEGLVDFLKEQTPAEETVKAIELAEAKAMALKEFDKYGVSDFYKKMIEKAGTVEGVKQLQSEVVEAAKANRIQEGTEGLVDFLKEQTPAEKTIKSIKLSEAKAAAKAELKAAGVSDFFISKIDGAKTVEGVKALKELILSSLAKPETDKPGTDKPEADKPEADKPEADKPEADKPEADKPEADKPEADKPEADKPEADKPEADKPEAGKSVPMTKLTPAKPVAPKAMAPKAANQLPSTGEATNPFFTAAAMAVMAGAGMVAFSAKRKED